MSLTEIIDDVAEARFYDDWAERFETEWEQYVRPGDRRVKKWANMAVKDKNKPVEHKAERAWMYVYNNVDYTLSKKWKSPRETINSRDGDCEDVTFLIASMLPNAGVEESKVAVGEIKHGEKTEYHTWNIVNGKVLDGTGGKDAISNQEYIPEKTWDVKIR